MRPADDEDDRPNMAEAPDDELPAEEPAAAAAAAEDEEEAAVLLTAITPALAAVAPCTLQSTNDCPLGAVYSPLDVTIAGELLHIE